MTQDPWGKKHRHDGRKNGSPKRIRALRKVHQLHSLKTEGSKDWVYVSS